MIFSLVEKVLFWKLLPCRGNESVWEVGTEGKMHITGRSQKDGNKRIWEILGEKGKEIPYSAPFWHFQKEHSPPLPIPYQSSLGPGGKSTAILGLFPGKG